LRGAGRDLAEDGELGELPQPVGERGPRDAERRAERFKRLRSEERFADDQECPGIGDDVQRARDRTIAFGAAVRSAVAGDLGLAEALVL
jgi:hypothetical protein